MAKLKAWEVLGLILAAAGHDVGHPGKHNPMTLVPCHPTVMRMPGHSPTVQPGWSSRH